MTPIHPYDVDWQPRDDRSGSGGHYPAQPRQQPAGSWLGAGTDGPQPAWNSSSWGPQAYPQPTHSAPEQAYDRPPAPEVAWAPEAVTAVTAVPAVPPAPPAPAPAPPTWAWTPDSFASGLITPVLRGAVAARLEVASQRHAHYALTRLGNPKDEPGPYALMIVSAEHRPPAPTPSLPDWMPRPAEPEALPARVRIESRVFPALDSPDLLQLLRELSQLAGERVASARSARRLLSDLNAYDRSAVATRAAGRKADPGAGFPYQAALNEGLLWDPRTLDGLGFTATDDAPITEHTVYLGVAVTSLDIPSTRQVQPWSQAKKAWRRQIDTSEYRFIPGNAVPGVGWALLEDGTAMRIFRPGDANLQQSVGYDVDINRSMTGEIGSKVRTKRVEPDLIHQAAPGPARANGAAMTSSELWEALATLHQVLRGTFNYPRSQEQAKP